MRWRPGFHGREDFQFQPDPDLRLIHLHRMDYELCRRRHATRERRRWNEHDVRRAGRPTTGSPPWTSSTAGFARTATWVACRSSSRRCAPDVARRCSEPPARPTAPTATACCCPRRARASSSGSGWCSTTRSTATWSGSGPGGLEAAEISGAQPRRQALEALREPRLPRFDLCAPLGGRGDLRRRHLRAGDRARGRSVARRHATCAALCARAAT